MTHSSRRRLDKPLSIADAWYACVPMMKAYLQLTNLGRVVIGTEAEILKLAHGDGYDSFTNWGKVANITGPANAESYAVVAAWTWRLLVLRFGLDPEAVEAAFQTVEDWHEFTSDEREGYRPRPSRMIER